MELSSEEWRLTHDANYEVSNLGRVRSLPREVHSGPKTGSGKRLVKGGLLTDFVSKQTGYMQVSLTGKERNSVHRLVAAAFCKGWFEGAHVNHINGKRWDNRAENLEWVTRSENLLHSTRVLKTPNKLKGRLGKDSNKAYPVSVKLIGGTEELHFDCAVSAIRAGIGKDSGAISRCCHGKSKFHNGYTWRFTAPEGWQC